MGSVTAPSALDLASADDTGSSNSDNITSQSSSLTISGSGGVAGNRLVLFDDRNNNNIIDTGEILTTAGITAAAWAADVSLMAGTHAVKAVQVNTAGYVQTLSSRLTNGVTSRFNSGIVSFGYVTAGSKNIAITIDGFNGAEDDIQIFTRSGRHLVGTAITDGTDNDATWGRNGIRLSTVKSVLLTDKNGFLPDAAYDRSSLNSGDPTGSYLFTTPLKAPTYTTTYNGMKLAYSGDADRIGAGDSNNDGNTYNSQTLEIAKIDIVTEDLVVVCSGIGVFSIKTSWDYFEANSVIGNSSPPSEALIVTVVTPPTALDLVAADDTGRSDSDNLTSQTSTLTISGSGGVVGATLVLFADQDNDGVIDSGEALATAAVTTTTWNADVDLVAGIHNIKAIQTLSGTSSTASAALLVTVDNTVPVLTGLDLAAVDDSGNSNSDDLTRQTSALTISGGSGEIGATLVLFEDKNSDGRIGSDEALVTTNVTAAVWAADVALTMGTHVIKAIQTDAAGNNSTASTALMITVDDGVPPVPTGLDLAAASDSGSSDSDNITNQTSALTIGGSGGMAGATLVLFADQDGDDVIDGSETLATIGVTTVEWTVNADLAAGTHAVKAVQILAGNSSVASAALNVTVDTTASTPTGLDLAASDDSGPSDSDNITRHTSDLSISGSDGEIGATLVLFDDRDNDGLIGAGEALNTMNVVATTWSADIMLAVGSHTIKAIQNDRAGNSSEVSVALPIVVNIPDDYAAAADTTGRLSVGHPATGMIEIAEDVDWFAINLTVGSVYTFDLVGLATAQGPLADPYLQLRDQNGTLLSVGEDGGASLSARLVYTPVVSGNYFVAAVGYGGSTGSYQLSASILHPPLLTGLDLAAADDSGVLNHDDLTNQVSSLTISGEGGVAGNTLVLFDDGNGNAVIDRGEELATTGITAAAWSADISLMAGTHSIRAVQTNTAGNSVASAALRVTIDTETPSMVTDLDLAAVDDSGRSSSDDITNQVSALTISGGGGEAGSVLVLFKDQNNDGVLDSGEALATTNVTATAWSADIDLTSATHAIRAVQMDRAGNLSPASMALDLTVTASMPAAPTQLDLATADDTGRSNSDNLTKQISDLTIAGNGGEVGAVLILFDDQDLDDAIDSGESLATTAVTATAWSADINLGAGSHAIKAVQTGVAGLTSLASAALLITIDTMAPAASTGLDLAAADDSGSSDSDNLTAQTSGLTISGSGGETSATLLLFRDTDQDGEIDNGEELATVAIGSSSSWSSDVGLHGGTHAIRAVQTDAAGNASSASVALVITVDYSTPASPTGLDLAAADDAGLSDHDDITNQTTNLTIGGNGHNGYAVTLFEGTTPLATTVVANGSWRVDTALVAGSHALTATQTSIAGISSVASEPLLLTIDTTAPVVPAVVLTNDTGSSASDNISREAELTVTAIENNATLQYSRDGSSWSSSFTANPGGNTVYVRQVDVAGNSSAASAALLFTWDLTMPAAPTVVLTNDTGSSASDQITNNGALTVTATESGATLQYNNNNGSWGTLFTAAANHSNYVYVRQIDAAGNISAVSTLLLFTLDTIAPLAPTVVLTHDTGISASDNITSNAALTLIGLEGGATPQYSTDGSSWGSSFRAVAGSNTVYVRQIDVAGNSGAASAPLLFTLDTTPPPAATALDLAATDDAGSSNSDDLTNQTSNLTLSGAGGDVGATLVLFRDKDDDGNIDAGEALVTTLVSATTWSADISLVSGTHLLKARQFDAAGNSGATSAALRLTVDTTAPAAPIVALAIDGGRSNSDQITNNGAVTVAGVESGAVVQYSNDGSHWDNSFGAIAGSNRVYTRQIDRAGNVSLMSNGLLFTLDTIAPTAVTGLDLAAADDMGLSDSDNITNRVHGLTFSGAGGEPGANLILFDDKNNNGLVDQGEGFTTVGVVTAAWSVDTGLWSGTHAIRAVQIDVAGNSSAASSILSMTTDILWPSVVTALDLSAADDSGSSNNDHITKQTSDLTIAGKGGEIGASLVLFDDYDNDGVIESGEALSTSRITSESWSVDVSLTPGRRIIRAVQIDVAGNSSDASAVLEVTVDTTAPAIPAALDLASADDSGNSNSDNITSQVSGLTLNGGGGEVGAMLILFDDKDSDGVNDSGEALTTTKVAGASWNADINLAAGSHAIKAIQTDAAGNSSPASAALTISVDSTLPAVPTGLDLATADDTGLSASDDITKNNKSLTISGGSGKAGNKLVLFADRDNDGVVDSGEGLTTITITSANSSWSGDVNLVAGSHNIRAIQTDAKGNKSDASEVLRLTVDTTTPALPTALDLASVDDTGLSNSDNITSQTSALTISGSGGEVGTTLVLFTDKDSDGVIDSGEPLTTTSIGGADWSVNLSLKAGSYAMKAIQTDLAGNSSKASTALAMTVDTTLPSVPVALDLAAADDNGVSNSDNVTSQMTGLTISGKGGEANAKIILFSDKNSDGIIDSGEALVTTSTTGASWNADISLVAGSHAIQAVQIDGAGNVSNTSTALMVTVNGVASPTTPTDLDLAVDDDDGSSNSDNITSKTTALTIRGSGGMVGKKLVLFDDKDNDGIIDSGEPLTTVNVTGATWGADIALKAGSHSIKAVQVDSASGASSLPSVALLVIVTAAAATLAAPTNLDLAAVDDTGVSNNDNITANTSALTISGSGIKGASLTLFDEEVPISTLSITAADGRWTKDISLPVGTHTIRASQRSDRGSSELSLPLRITIDPAARSARSARLALAIDSYSSLQTLPTDGLGMGGFGTLAIESTGGQAEPWLAMVN
ncbi:MAG: hypothetical protein HQL60_02505 [Magnetococcales bacterium]|nr:hypothetical protein [Magnetococcales bacterium]